jgi:hypothetical protein
MTDFEMARSMAINSTLFQHKSIHLPTCRSPGSLSANQTDHIMMNSHHATDITNFKSCVVAVIVKDVKREMQVTTQDCSHRNNKMTKPYKV